MFGIMSWYCSMWVPTDIGHETPMSTIRSQRSSVSFTRVIITWPGLTDHFIVKFILPPVTFSPMIIKTVYIKVGSSHCHLLRKILVVKLNLWPDWIGFGFNNTELIFIMSFSVPAENHCSQSVRECVQHIDSPQLVQATLPDCMCKASPWAERTINVTRRTQSEYCKPKNML